MSDGSIGSLIMDIASLLFMAGILAYTAMYRRRGRPDDLLFFAMTVINIVLAASDAVSFLMEGRSVPGAGDLIMVCNIFFFMAFELFAGLFVLYLDYRAYRSKERVRRQAPFWLFPCVLLFFLLLANLATGWIYTVDSTSYYHAGPLNFLVFIPAALYFAVSLLKAYRIDPRIPFLALLIIAVRIAWGIWFREISSTAFTYTLLLACTHIHVMNEPLNEELT